jgi:hypothetical protein
MQQSDRHSSSFRINIKTTPWPESANKLYRPSDCRLSAKTTQFFRVEEKPRNNNKYLSSKYLCSLFLLLPRYFAYSSSLKTEVKYSSETK